jgi:hypothetical protein
MGASLIVLLVSAALIAAALGEQAVAATPSDSASPWRDQEALTSPAGLQQLPELPTRAVAPRQVHAPEEAENVGPGPVELEERRRSVAPKPVVKRLPPSEEVALPQPTVSDAQPAPQPEAPSAQTAAATTPPPPPPPADKPESDDKSGAGTASPSTALAPNAPAPVAANDLVGILMQRGDELLKLRDIAAARLLYERAALLGNARAAMLAGKTYDPLYFAEIGASGIAPDRAKALEWYGAAATLGDGEAAARTEKLRNTSHQ